MTIRRDRCETCRFWELPHPNDPGVCHRFPTSVDKERNDWCGEWRELPAVDTVTALQIEAA